MTRRISAFIIVLLAVASAHVAADAQDSDALRAQLLETIRRAERAIEKKKADEARESARAAAPRRVAADAQNRDVLRAQLREAIRKAEQTVEKLRADGARASVGSTAPRRITENRPSGCPAVADCTQNDECITLRLPPLANSQPGYTCQGTYAFTNLFAAAAARGVENATIRAMNATRVCPTCKAPHAEGAACNSSDAKAAAAKTQ